MRIIRLKPRPLGTFLGLLLLCSCATTPEPSTIIPASELPADVTMNEEAGRGNVLFVTLRLEGGEELPFIVDTGAGATCFDKSLEAKLGKRLGSATVGSWGTKMETGRYAAPRLYLGNTPLMTGSNVVTLDFQELSTTAGRPVRGVLGLDCLYHYCIQLDFAADRMRFLDDEHSNKKDWGTAFPLVALGPHDARPSIRGNLAGTKGSRSLIDTGCNYDGWLMPNVFQRWTNHAQRPANGEVRSPNGALGGETYPDIDLHRIDVESDGIGLSFLSRHLVTLDFPKRTMYLKRVSVGRLVDENVDAAKKFLKNLKENGQQPGWSKDDHGAFRSYPEVSPDSVTFNLQKNGDSSIYHYTVTRSSKDSPWKLQKAWRTDQSGQTIEEYPVP
jgi:hypothetical protein